jgi:hypothetical protein
MMVPKTRYADWRELPYRRIFVEDTEYYPGAGLDHGGREGDLPTPLCSSVIELRSGQVQQWWQGEPNPLLPRLEPDDLYVSYFLPAEFSQRRAHGAGRPPNAIDAYTEFRHLTISAGRLVTDTAERRGAVYGATARASSSRYSSGNSRSFIRRSNRSTGISRLSALICASLTAGVDVDVLDGFAH